MKLNYQYKQSIISKAKTIEIPFTVFRFMARLWTMRSGEFSDSIFILYRNGSRFNVNFADEDAYGNLWELKEASQHMGQFWMPAFFEKERNILHKQLLKHLKK